jgi:hypothetical protein
MKSPALFPGATHTRNFHASWLVLGQRFALGTPRQIRFHLTNGQQQGSISGSTKPGPHGRKRHTGYPTYLKVGGGFLIVGTVFVYFHYQNYAPMTNRRRWIASSPEFEKEIGDQVGAGSAQET